MLRSPFSRHVIVAVTLVALGSTLPANAGVFDQLKEMNQTVKDHTDLAEDMKQTGEDVKGVVPESDQKAPKKSKDKAASRARAKWHVESKGKSEGPYTTDQIGGLIAEGKVETETLVWKKGMDEWSAAGSTKALEKFFAEKPPPLPGR